MPVLASIALFCLIPLLTPRVAFAQALAGPPGSQSSSPGSDSNGSAEKAQKDGPFYPGKEGVSFPACTHCPDPRYPKAARGKHIEGIVVLQAIIQPDGHASDIKLLKSLTPDFDQAAIEAVKTWRFRPARAKDKTPVPVLMPIEVTFRLVN